MPSSDIGISPEVAKLLTPQLLADLRDAQAHPGYVCPFCDEHGRLDDPHAPTSLVVFRFLPIAFTRAFYAHAACSPSTVLNLNAYPSVARHSTVYASCMLNDHADPPAGLIIGCVTRIYREVADGAVLDRYAAELTDQGLQPLADLDQPVRQVPGLAITINGRHVHVTVPGGGTLFDGTLACPPEWLAAARNKGRITVITAAGLDLIETPADTAEDQATRLAALDYAVRTGHTVAGVAHVTIADQRTGQAA